MPAETELALIQVKEGAPHMIAAKRSRQQRLTAPGALASKPGFFSPLLPIERHRTALEGNATRRSNLSLIISVVCRG